jgi:hypothetical protein
MPRRARVLALAVAAALPALAAAEGPTAPGPTGLTFTASLGGGGEVGLDHGKAGILEVEGTAGYEWAELGFRGELGLALGLDPDTHVALRPGVRWSMPALPIQLRAALDAASSREGGLHWRWLLVGLATEVRLTGLLGLYAEVDSGAPLSSIYGVPLLVRGGASFRF